MRPRIAVSVALAIVAALILRPGTVVACQTAGWTLENLAKLPTVIVEAKVTRDLSGPGWELRVIRSVRGASPGETLVVGAEPRGLDDCFGQPDLGKGDHVVIALQQPRSAMWDQMTVWWIHEDGTTVDGWTGMYSEQDWSTLSEVWANLKALPDTATEDVGAAVDVPLQSWLLAVAFVLGAIVFWRRLAVPLAPRT